MTTSDWIAISAILLSILGGFGTVAIILFKFLLNTSNTIAEIKSELKQLLTSFANMEKRWEMHDDRIRRLEKKHR